MLRFILLRLLTILPITLLVVTASFFLMRSAPGSPFVNSRTFSPEVVESLNRQYGLDKPIFFVTLLEPQTLEQPTSWLTRLTFRWNGVNNQYWNYVSSIARGDLGPSTRYEGRRVGDIIFEHFPYSAILGAISFALALTVGLALGVGAAVRQNSGLDRLVFLLTTVAVSVPAFVLGPVLVLLFSLTWYWLPPARWGGVRHLILPVLTLSLAYTAIIARLTRDGMAAALQADYIRTARAKGLREAVIVLRHALRNAVLPVISFSGPVLAFLLGGTVVVERLFVIPGLGSFFIEAATARDYTVVMGIVIVTAVLILVANLVTDVVTAWVDPRIRHEISR
ncbi:MAG: ABC transporter permease [Blastocatellia bacterium]|nr:ABC transporter permease [Blastocatellia bacterium]